MGRRARMVRAVSACPPTVADVKCRRVRRLCFHRARSALLEKIRGVAELGQHVQTGTVTLAGRVCSVATDQVDRAESIARVLIC